MAMRRTVSLAALGALLAPLSAAAHMMVLPKQSPLGQREKYVVRAPNEKRIATVSIEAQFPPDVRVTSFEEKPGWRIEPKRDDSGAIVGATWTGNLPPDQFAEFGLMAINPKAGVSLTWKFTQVYADGSRVEWTGPKGASTPAPQVDLLSAGAAEAHH